MAAQKTAAAVRETERSSQDAAEHATEVYDELLTLSRENMEKIGTASLSMLNGLASVGSGWASAWTDQALMSLEATQKLAGCRTWQDMAAVQNDFTRASLERMCSEITRSANLTTGAMTETLGPLQELTERTMQTASRQAA